MASTAAAAATAAATAKAKEACRMSVGEQPRKRKAGDASLSSSEEDSRKKMDTRGSKVKILAFFLHIYSI